MKEAFLDKVCAFRWVIAIMFSVNVMFFLVTAFSLPATEPGTEARFISWVTIGIVGVSLTILTPLIYACRHHARDVESE